jgi:hypothetical protein
MQSGVLAWSDNGVEEEKKQIGRARHEKGCHASQLLERSLALVQWRRRKKHFPCMLHAC